MKQVSNSGSMSWHSAWWTHPVAKRRGPDPAQLGLTNEEMAVGARPVRAASQFVLQRDQLVCELVLELRCTRPRRLPRAASRWACHGLPQSVMASNIAAIATPLWRAMPVTKDLVIFTQTCDLLTWLLPQCEHFPNSQRFVVTQRLLAATPHGSPGCCYGCRLDSCCGRHSARCQQGCPTNRRARPFQTAWPGVATRRTQHSQEKRAARSGGRLPRSPSRIGVAGVTEFRVAEIRASKQGQNATPHGSPGR